jgi:glycosyltransferase involved in cell wall biosynthesis
MRIIFDLRKVGLGNNGGSSTIIKSANTLHNMGHKVFVVDSMRNQHTWTKLIPPHIKAKNPGKLPNADMIIATGYKSVGPTVSAPERCGIKAHWIRAWETWQMNEKQIVRKVLAQPTIKLVNSICLKDRLKAYNVNSYIIRPGYDLEIIRPLNLRNHDAPPVLGALYREGIHGKRKRTEWVLKATKIIKKYFKGIELHVFGSEPKPNNPVIDKYLRLPTMKQKSVFYNGIHIWVAPTMSEGLHMPPAEAMMTKCPVVGTRAPLSGMQDYLKHEETGIVTDDDLSSFVTGIISLIKDKEKRIEYGENARKRILEIGDREKNMQKLVDLIGELK